MTSQEPGSDSAAPRGPLELLESGSFGAATVEDDLRERREMAAMLVAPEAPELGRIIDVWDSIPSSERDALASYVESHVVIDETPGGGA